MKRNLTLFLLFFVNVLFAEDGSRLWLRYEPLPPPIAQQYSNLIRSIKADTRTETARIAVGEFRTAFQKMTGQTILLSENKQTNQLIFKREKRKDEAYAIQSFSSPRGNVTVISSPNDVGFLYGVFHLLRLMQTQSDITRLNISEKPSYDRRILNHWEYEDIMDHQPDPDTGDSIWEEEDLQETRSQSYIDYARANASIGINGIVLNSTEADPEFIEHENLLNFADIAKIFRPYGIKIYLVVNFDSPSKIGGQLDSDPLNPDVRRWWKEKAEEIYDLIPDMGGFLIEGHSNELPGPQYFGRTHADGANVLAEALEPYNGIVMWRHYVYKPQSEGDRAKQDYEEFMPFDGQFRKNVIIQVKNGPIDFQPREAFNPLFGGMQKTNLMLEFQIAQERYGFFNSVVFLSPLFKECLESDTYAKGPGSTVAKVTDGTLFHQSVTAIAGVVKVGDIGNWKADHFAQANWYSFGRLAWNHKLSSEKIADEWLRMTFSNDPAFVEPVKKMMLDSRETAVNYMMPIGLTYLYAWNHNHGPEPWLSPLPNILPYWTPAYYHRADSVGLGFDRTTNGSDAVSQYFPPLRDIYNRTETCPENLLLWFHHVPWNYRMHDGKTLWDELCYRYQGGVDSVRQFQKTWDNAAGYIDKDRFKAVQNILKVQLKDAIKWRDACLLYFQTYSHQPFPKGVDRPENDLKKLKAVTHRWF